MTKLFIYKEEDLHFANKISTLYNGFHYLGRETPIVCNDKRISRNHARILVHKNGAIIESVHVNPTFFKSSISSVIQLLRENESIVLNNGDCFALLEDAAWFKVKITYDNMENTVTNELPTNNVNKRSIDEDIFEISKKIKLEGTIIEETTNYAVPRDLKNTTIRGSVVTDPNLPTNEIKIEQPDADSSSIIHMSNAEDLVPIHLVNKNKDPIVDDNQNKSNLERTIESVAAGYNNNPSTTNIEIEQAASKLALKKSLDNQNKSNLERTIETVVACYNQNPTIPNVEQVASDLVQDSFQNRTIESVVTGYTQTLPISNVETKLTGSVPDSNLDSIQSVVAGFQNISTNIETEQLIADLESSLDRTKELAPPDNLLTNIKTELPDSEQAQYIPMPLPLQEIKLEPTDDGLNNQNGLGQNNQRVKKEPPDPDQPSRCTNDGLNNPNDLGQNNQRANIEPSNPNQPSSSTNNIPEWKKENPEWRRDRCWYGKGCYRKNSTHKKDFSHAGDDDYDSDDNDNRPLCPFGVCCYRINIQHRRQYKHFGKPATRRPNVQINLNINGCPCCNRANHKPDYESDCDDTDPE